MIEENQAVSSTIVDGSTPRTQIMLIKRPQLIERIRPFYNDHLVKVITGLRRTGKSSLLRLIADDLKETQGRSESSFLFLNFESIANQDLLNPVALYKHIAAAKSAQRI